MLPGYSLTLQPQGSVLLIVLFAPRTPVFFTLFVRRLPHTAFVPHDRERAEEAGEYERRGRTKQTKQNGDSQRKQRGRAGGWRGS